MPLKRFAHLPAVVLVGRPNVGKSTLYNRITGSRRAIVTPVAGTTRDTNSHPADWQGVAFTLVDTGGLFGASDDPLHALVVQHGRKALDAADVIVFVVDGREGLVSADEEIAETLRFAAAPVIMAVNKTDDKRARGRALEFYQLGFDPVVEIAAEHGEGTGDLLDEIVSKLPRREGVPASEPPETAVAIVGRPNVGKSSLLNRLLKEERSIVSDIPGDDARQRRRFDPLASPRVSHRRHRGDPAARPGHAIGSGRSGERRARAPRDREGGRRPCS